MACSVRIRSRAKSNFSDLIEQNHSDNDQDDLELIYGSGNVYRDLGERDADVRQAKALLAAEIIKALDAEQLSTRQAEARTGINYSEFSRIRRANLDRFTIDRLISILARLNQEVKLSITTQPKD